MGGKQNRTRNNVRPSNSGRSAAMLHSTLPQFSGFSDGNKSSGLSSFASSPTEEFDSSIDDNFQLVLKKVSKKDFTTKLKGLQEFADLLQKAEQPIVKALLPIWPRFYSLLVIHPDNRIREATQNVHHIIVQKAKRDIAPYLKQLMAPWYTSQYDNYPPAAMAAIQAFKVTFTPIKFKEAVNFCHCEILNYIHDNLLIQTAQTVASQQLSSQEAEARYERVVISCLQGYSVYLREVSTEKITESASLNVQIVSNKKFWKLATSQIPLIRSSWFQVLSVILQEAVHLLKSKEAQSLTTIFNNLEDGESTVLPHVWECLLLATAIPEWWKYANLDQHFVPKILNVLKQAGHGNASVIYPNFLPLLSNMPIMDEKKKKQFYTNFFENMCIGLKLKSVASSTQETKAISTAYIECLQFLITRNVSNTLLCKNLVKQFCGLIEWCFTKEAVSYKAIFSQSLNFILYLRKNSTLEDIRLLIEYFFSSLYDIFYRTISLYVKVQYVGLVAGKQVELLLSLKKIPTVENNPDNSDYYLNMVNDFGVKIFKIYLNYTERESSNELFGQLYILIDGFDKNILLGNLLEQLKEANASPRYMDIYRKWFSKWLLSDQMYCESVLDIIFLIMAEVDGYEKELILNDLLESNNPDCITCAISKALCRPHVEDPIIQNWLKGTTVGELFVAIAENYITNEGSSESVNILKSALRVNSSGDLLINKDALNKIIEKLSLIILKEPMKKPSMNLSCSLAAHICKIIYTEAHQLTYRDELLLPLFHLSCKVDGENNFISQDTIKEVNLVWKESLLVLLQNLNNGDSQTLIANFFKLVEDNFRLTVTTKRRRYADHLCKIVSEIVDTVYKGRMYLLTWLVEFLFSKSMIIRENIVSHCKVAEYVKGTLDSPYDEIHFQKSLDEERILSYFIYNFLYLQVLNTPLNSNADNEEEVGSSDEFSTEGDSSGITVFNISEKPAVDFLEVLYSYTVTDSFLVHFNNVKHHNELLYYHCLCEPVIRDIVTDISKHTLSQLKILLKDNCLKQAWFWCKTEYVFYTKFLKPVDVRSIHNDLMCNVANSSSLAVLHMDQILNNSDQELNDETASLFLEIESFRNENMPQFLFERSDMSWQQINKVIKSVKQCTRLMETSTLSQRHWDLIVLSMVSWISNCLKAKRLINQYQYQSMLISVINLYTATCTKIAKSKIEQTNPSFVSEWDDVLLEIIHGDIAQIWIFLADHFSNYTEDSLLNLPILQSFGKVTDFLRFDLIFKGNDNVPKWTKFLKISSSSLLTNSQAILQLWGYKMLLILVPGLVTIDDEAVNTTTPHKNGLIFEQFKEKLIEVQDIVNSLLLDFRIGENSCKVEPSYDSFTYTFAYLLLWDVMINLCEKASTELRYQYSDWLKNGSLFHQFLSILFKLMPTEVLEQDEGKLRFSSDSFLSSPVDSSSCYFNFCGNDVIENLACYLYKSSLEQFPALVRQWWTVLDIKTSQIVEKITVLYVSPHICTAELNNVLQHQNIFKNLKVKVMPSVREIQAVYTVDETQMELAITLPSNYPLGSPNIVCNRQISGTSQKQWLLQFKKCVLHQNGKIWDGLYLWNSNLDRKFEGVEECYICYAVLHSGTYQLPKLSCRTCKKKFHSACLYKWFSTSNKSSCPICRNLF